MQFANSIGLRRAADACHISLFGVICAPDSNQHDTEHSATDGDVAHTCRWNKVSVAE